MHGGAGTDGIHISGRARIEGKIIYGYVPDVVGREYLAAVDVGLREGDLRRQRRARDDHTEDERWGGDLHVARRSGMYAESGSGGKQRGTNRKIKNLRPQFAWLR